MTRRAETTMHTDKAGVVYVATRREHYLAEAFLSAHSVKAFEADLPVTLFTDLPESPFASAPCFDNVEPIQTSRIITGYIITLSIPKAPSL